MKILITGANGMLAQEVKKRFSGNELVLTDAAELDITDLEKVRAKVSEIKPEVLINCAAFTNVDGAETAGKIVEKVNAEGPKNLAIACKENDVILVHISTDYVFGGMKDIDDVYSEDDEKSPATAYGRTKLNGELGIIENTDKYYIFRTAWLYGHGGKNFVDTMIAVGKSQIEKNGENAEVTVVNDQHGSPTYAVHLANFIYEAVTKKIPFGIYNATNNGFTTWCDFTKEIYKEANVHCKVRGISSEEYEINREKSARAKALEEGTEYVKPITANRPKNSQMSKAKLEAAGVEVPTWQDGLKQYLAGI